MGEITIRQPHHRTILETEEPLVTLIYFPLVLTTKIAYLSVYMTTLYQKIGEEFLSRLANSTEIDPKKVERLRSLLASGKKLKVQELVTVFTGSDENEVK